MTVAQCCGAPAKGGMLLRPTRPLFAAAVAAAFWMLFPAAATAQGVWGPYGWYPPFGYAYGRPYSSLRLQISPRDTEVFIDGYYAGIVDDFDGIFQRLHLDSGPHRIEVRAPGYEPLVFEVRITPDHTTTYQGEMKRIP